MDLRGAGRTVIERMGVMDRVRAVALDQRGVAWVDARGRVTARMPVDAFDGRRDHLRDRGAARRPRGRPARRHPRTRRVRLRRHRDGSSPGRRRRRRHVRARAAAAVRPRHRGRRPLLPDPTAGLRRRRGPAPAGLRDGVVQRSPDRPRRLVPHAQRAGRAGGFAAPRPHARGVQGRAGPAGGPGHRPAPRRRRPAGAARPRLRGRGLEGADARRRHGHGERLRVHGRRAGAPAAVVAGPGGARRRRGRLPDAADRPRHERRAGAGLRPRGRAGQGARRPPGRVRRATRPSLVRTSRPRSSYRPAASTATPRAARWRSGCARRRCGR